MTTAVRNDSSAKADRDHGRSLIAREREVEKSFHLVDTDTSWQDQGACRGTLKLAPEAFYPEHGSGAGAYREGRKVCEGCPVRERCLEFAIVNHIGTGLWGGHSPVQRRQIWRRHVPTPAHLKGKF